MNTSSRISSGATTACFPANRQHGAVLIITLVMLLLLTLIGIVGMQDTNLQERMAGNQWDRNMAFQGAEAGLRVGEGWLEGPANDPTVGISRRKSAESHDPLVKLWAEYKNKEQHQVSITEWDGSVKKPAAEDAEAEYILLGDFAGKAHLDGDTAPPFHVNPPSFLRQPSDINLNQAELECQRIYPVISRSVGGTDTAVVVLRTTYIPRQSGMVICPNPDEE